jgi:hypothetical protein
LYTRYAALSFVLDDESPEHAMDVLAEAGSVGPSVTSGWNWEDYARMGEASLQTGSPMTAVMEYLRDVWNASQGGMALSARVGVAVTEGDAVEDRDHQARWLLHLDGVDLLPADPG